jgi:integrase
MGSSRRRVGSNGRLRYVALYRDARGRQRSAGTFATKKLADRAWQHAEAVADSGRPGDPRCGCISFSAYVNDQWFPNHILEPSTRESYRYCLDKHILPWFGTMKMRDILPAHVREWVTELMASGVTPAHIRHLKIILSAVFTTALNDFVIVVHPCRGVKTPTVAIKELHIVTPEEYARLAGALTTDSARLFVEVGMGSGLRWGELTELRPRDLNLESGILTVSRAISEVDPKFHPHGGRFHIKSYPKSKRPRRLKLDPLLVTAIAAHIQRYKIAPDHLLFQIDQFEPAPEVTSRLVDAETLGFTEPNAAGRRYQHGALSAYTAGRCRCEHCRASFARYRAERRARGLDSPRGKRNRDSDGHLPRDWFRFNVWYPACKKANLEPRPRLHDLRHSHASWLLAGGANLQVVRERLGHANIATTNKYLHTLPTADETALAALRRIRGEVNSGQVPRGSLPRGQFHGLLQ